MSEQWSPEERLVFLRQHYEEAKRSMRAARDVYHAEIIKQYEFQPGDIVLSNDRAREARVHKVVVDSAGFPMFYAHVRRKNGEFGLTEINNHTWAWRDPVKKEETA